MKRRTFLQSTLASAAIAPVLLDTVYARPSSPLKLLAQLDTVANDKILILVQLFGGNDGLNTVVPADNDTYYTLRPNIGIQKNTLYNFGGVYFNPGLQYGDKRGFAGMFEAGTLAVLRGIGYPNPNLSHFRSTDIWLSGINDSNANDTLSTGWLGRFLEQRYPNFPNQLPTDPLAINFGGFSLALTSEKGRMGIEVDNPNLQAGGLSAANDTLDDNANGTRYAIEYAFVQDIANRSNVYAQRVKDAYTTGKAMLKGNYAGDGFSQQMASVAALIAGGLDTRVYMVNLGGFDTHVNQVSGGDPTHSSGAHTNLLATLSNAIAQFQYDMTMLDQTTPKISDRVVGLTISEFGRRPHDNGSWGTDHGAASVQFLFGSQVNSGVFGDPFDLDHLDSNGDLVPSIDFRQVYAAILTDWFGITPTDAQTVLQDQNAGINPLAGLFKAPAGVSSASPIDLSLSIYPNPVSSRSRIAFMLSQDAYTELEIASVDGKRVQMILGRSLAAGSHDIPFSPELPSGAYILSLRSGGEMVTQVLEIIR